MYTYRKGILRVGDKILPLPIAESYRLSCRIALAVLLDYFQGENHAERKAFALHYALARRISGIYDGWIPTFADLNMIITDIFCRAKGEPAPIEILFSERRDILRRLCESPEGRNASS